VSRTGVQRNLLKLMEEAEVDLKTPHDLASQVEAAMEAQRTGKVTRHKINTRNILFIVSGAFNGLEDMIRKRLNMQRIGFEKGAVSASDKQNLLKKLTTEDLMHFGFESEFVGRLPVYVVLNELTVDGLFNILKNRFSTVVLGKKLDFRAYGIDLKFSDEALYLLAERAHREKTGARGLLSVFEKTLIKFEKTLPSTEIKELMADKTLVENPEQVLAEMMLNDSIKNYQKNYLVKHGIFLEFDEKALEIIQRLAKESRKSISQLCEDFFHDYHHGIKLMEKDSFRITAEAVENPDAFLESYIKQNYRKRPGGE
jgi:ATP-dependent protease Clp ATPase subunit